MWVTFTMVSDYELDELCLQLNPNMTICKLREIKILILQIHLKFYF